MKLYEGLFLFDANLATKDWPGLENHVGDLLKKHEAELVFSERWPDRKLAYEVKGCRKGTYFLTYFNAPGNSIPAIHRDVQLSERVLRLMVLQNEYIEEVLEKHQERQAEREAAAKEKEAADSEAADTADAPAEKAPVAEEEAGKEEAPAAEEEAPAAEEEAPAAEEEAPAAEEEAPAAEEESSEGDGAEEAEDDSASNEEEAKDS